VVESSSAQLRRDAGLPLQELGGQLGLTEQLPGLEGAAASVRCKRGTLHDTAIGELDTGQDFSPCWLPNGRIAFISERRGGYGRCHGRPVPVYTLHTMNADGSDVVCISYHESNEWSPSVTSTGLIVYTRWDYVDRLLPWPEGTKIESLRIVQVLPKTTPRANGPRIGYGDQKGARAVLGTVPVEEDGSAYFDLPVGRPVYFQALDGRGLAVQSMRSDTYVHPGETLVCRGCHQPHTSTAPAAAAPLAMRRAPSTIRPDVDGSNPLSFPRLVQPVLDRHCAACHDREPDAPDLKPGDWTKNAHRWYTSYENLRDVAFFWDGAGWTSTRTTPGQFGARASKLYAMLTEGHYDVKLPPEDLHRITLWLDSNSDFFGSYEDTESQARGEVVRPTLQ